MNTTIENITINDKIDTLQKIIDFNEKEQDKFITENGFYNDDLYNEHELMMNYMESLLKRRRNGEK